MFLKYPRSSCCPVLLGPGSEAVLSWGGQTPLSESSLFLTLEPHPVPMDLTEQKPRGTGPGRGILWSRQSSWSESAVPPPEGGLPEPCHSAPNSAALDLEDTHPPWEDASPCICGQGRLCREQPQNSACSWLLHQPAATSILSGPTPPSRTEKR